MMVIRKEVNIRIIVECDYDMFNEQDVTGSIVAQLSDISDNVTWGNDSGYHSKGVLAENWITEEYSWKSSEVTL